MIQLDTLRAVSIILVLIQHFSPKKSFFGSEGVFPLGFIGVDIFFVLSGFLITKSLIREKDEEITLFRKAVRFTGKRALRLFPVYYLVLFIGLFFNFYDIKDFWPWMFGYASNFLAAKDGHPTWGYTQFWSLAVEEQFYLIWPWFVWLLPLKNLKSAFLAFAASGLIVRGLMYFLDFSPIAIRFSTFALLDLFGMGALLAYYHHFKRGPEKRETFKKVAWLGLLGMITVMVCRVLKLPYLSNPGISLMFFSFFGAMVYVHLVNITAIGLNWGKAFWENPFLIHVGKVSYGIYVYHNFVLLLLPLALSAVGLSMTEIFIIDFTLLTALTLLISTLSWHVFEKQVLKLKERL
jgi:peptidoglycan/LPS O-acetylase OafA/YrhL